MYTSYESPNTQLLWAQGTRVWHTHGGPTPTSLQKIYIFSFWGRGGHMRLMKWKNNVLYQISLSHNPKSYWLWIYSVINSWKNVRLKYINLSWLTLYMRSNGFLEEKKTLLKWMNHIVEIRNFSRMIFKYIFT